MAEGLIPSKLVAERAELDEGGLPDATMTTGGRHGLAASFKAGSVQVQGGLQRHASRVDRHRGIDGRRPASTSPSGSTDQRALRGAPDVVAVLTALSISRS